MMQSGSLLSIPTIADRHKAQQYKHKQAYLQVLKTQKTVRQPALSIISRSEHACSACMCQY